MHIPGAERAEIDVRKLSSYCLDPNHPIGKHKAKVFRSALGIGPGDALLLVGELRSAVRSGDAVLGTLNEFGQRYIVDFEMSNGSLAATVRSVWIVEIGSDRPRLITCFVL